MLLNKLKSQGKSSKVTPTWLKGKQGFKDDFSFTKRQMVILYYARPSLSYSYQEFVIRLKNVLNYSERVLKILIHVEVGVSIKVPT